MSDSKAIITSSLEVIIPSTNESVFVCDLNEHTLQIMLNMWWALMSIPSKRAVSWNHTTQQS
jgi:hypothetical protein